VCVYIYKRERERLISLVYLIRYLHKSFYLYFEIFYIKNILCYYLFLTPKKIKKRKGKKIEKENLKIQEDTHKSLENYPSLWWMIKMTNEKVGGLGCIRLGKLVTKFWLIKHTFDVNIFIENYPSLWWMTKMTNEKVGGLGCIRLI